MSEKVYVGSGTEKTIKGQNGNFNVINLYFSQADLAVMMDKKNQTAKGGVVINLYKKQKPSEYGQTHYGVLSTFEPKDGQPVKSNSTTAVKSVAVNDVINKYKNAGVKNSDTITVTKQDDLSEDIF